MANVSYEWWNKLRGKTFDKWAVDYGITLKEIEGYDHNIFDRWKIKERHLNNSKKSNPLGYFFLYVVPDVLEYLIESPEIYFIETKHWIRYRIFDKYHIVKTGEKPGYRCTDFIMTACIWNLVVDFVEQECAWMEVYCFEDEKEAMKKLKRERFFGKLRSRELGEKYMKRRCYDRQNSEDRRLACRAILKAYKFYKDELPALNEELEMMYEAEDREGLTRKQRLARVKKCAAFEEKINKKITNHLVKIVENRDVLWT